MWYRRDVGVDTREFSVHGLESLAEYNGHNHDRKYLIHGLSEAQGFIG
jgi:hypothetical protein